MGKKITLEDLEILKYSSADFKNGSKVIIYLNYNGGQSFPIEIREGEVLNSHAEKRFLDIPHTPCLQLKVTKVGQIRGNKLKLKRKNYTQKYLYANMGLIKKL